MRQRIGINGNIKTVVFIGILAVLSLSQSGCIQSQSVAATRFNVASSASIPERTVKIVNNTFYASFVDGDWFYQGAQAVNGTINAYIQIPQKLDMSLDAQKHYLRQAICPSANEVKLWNNLRGVPLSVHVYTYKKKYGVYAECKNPLV